MALYENEDLITNIHGAYQDKSYDDVTRDYNFVGKDEQDASRIESVTQGKSYAELAREEARRDIRKKRQDYLSKEVKAPSKAALQQQLKATIKPKKNNYDFLKESQIYNKEVLQSQREHKVAQELNLTRFDDAK